MAEQKVDDLQTGSNRQPEKKQKNKGLVKFLAILLAAIIAGFAGGYYGNNFRDDSDVNNQAAQQVADDESSLITQIAKDVGQSVVSISVHSKGNQQTVFGAVPTDQESAGTGFILNKDGVIVTNRHVVPENSDEVSVTLSDGTELTDIEVIGRTSSGDPLDIAFLKINDKKGKELKPVELGDSSKVEVGQKVVAIGNALGQFQNSVTSGIISGYGRSIDASDGQQVDTLQNLFQTDASINQGNSGGPLVDMNGKVIGINTAVAGNAENIGFAIPISDVSGLITGVLEKGELLRPFLGVRYVNLTDDIAYKLNLNTKRGAYIAPLEGGQNPIIKDSPAAKAGLQEKDIIVKVNDTEIDDKNGLASVLGRYKVGDKVNLTVIRGDETKNIEVTLENAP